VREKLQHAVRRLYTGVPLRLVLIAPITGFVLLCIVWYISDTTDIAAGDLLRDAATVNQTPWYIGAMSNLGVLAWWAGAAISLFVASILFRNHANRRDRYALASLGGLSAMLALDDLYMFHETYFWRTPLSDLMTPLVYGTLILSFLYLFREFLLDNGGILLLLALGFVGMSMLIDLSHDFHLLVVNDSTTRYLVEDGSKLIGTLSWLVFSTFASHRVITSYINQTALSDVDRRNEPQRINPHSSRVA
jgi:hypothetical protein